MKVFQKKCPENNAANNFGKIAIYKFPASTQSQETCMLMRCIMLYTNINYS